MQPINTVQFVAALNWNYVISEFTSHRYITFTRVEVLVKFFKAELWGGKLQIVKEVFCRRTQKV
jgi:hypothetical protein